MVGVNSMSNLPPGVTVRDIDDLEEPTVQEVIDAATRRYFRKCKKIDKKAEAEKTEAMKKWIAECEEAKRRDSE